MLKIKKTVYGIKYLSGPSTGVIYAKKRRFQVLAGKKCIAEFSREEDANRFVLWYNRYKGEKK